MYIVAVFFLAEAETAVKSGKNRTNPQALPYIVSTSSPTSSDKEGALSPGMKISSLDYGKLVVTGGSIGKKNCQHHRAFSDPFFTLNP